MSAILHLSTAIAHDDHDWRLDYEAYLNVHYEMSIGLVIPKATARPVRIDIDFFKEKLSVFANIDRRTIENLDISRNFLIEEYKKLGFEVSLHVFGGGTNFIAEKKGTVSPEKILILSSHIDTVGNKGANDNGTGTIGALVIAKELSKKKLSKTIRIIGFDREEVGLKGSDAYVAAIQDKKAIIGNINLEMMGYHSRNDGSFHVIDCDRPVIFNVPKPYSEFLSLEIKKSIETLGIDLSVVKTCTGRSDHASFWRHNIPAIVISENFFGGDADPCYHSKCDVVDERLNYDYVEKILEVVLDTTEKLLE